MRVMTAPSERLQTRLWEIVEAAKAGDKASRVFDVTILALIFLNVVGVIVESVSSIQAEYGELLRWFEVFSVSIFTVEYLARLWSCVADAKYKGTIRGRIKYAFTAMAIIDLLAIAPFYLPFVGIDLRAIRVLRLFRILRLAKVGRYYSSLTLLRNVLRNKKEELILTTVIMMMLLVISSSFMFYAENGAQPEVFSSIPASMWWAMATLTTVGYGDVYPITVWGKFFASCIAILGIGMFALPTGILGAGFVEEIERRKSGPQNCPHCGEELAS